MKKSEIYKDANRDYYERNKDNIKERGRKKYQENKEYYRKIHKEYYERNKSKVNKQINEKYNENRYRFIQMYGGKCVCCGETSYEFLVIEHVNGQKGLKKKETSNTAYRNAIKKFDTTRYTILCSNCNHATRYGAICPHKRDVRIEDWKIKEGKIK